MVGSSPVTFVTHSQLLVNWIAGKSIEIPWNSPNPWDYNEGVARLRSIGPIVGSYMDLMVEQGASVTHIAPTFRGFSFGLFALSPWFLFLWFAGPKSACFIQFKDVH